MRNEQTYVTKYGQEAGSIIFRLLQKEAAHAGWKDRYRKKLKQCQDQIKKLEGSKRI